MHCQCVASSPSILVCLLIFCSSLVICSSVRFAICAEVSMGPATRTRCATCQGTAATTGCPGTWICRKSIKARRRMSPLWCSGLSLNCSATTLALLFQDTSRQCFRSSFMIGFLEMIGMPFYPQTFWGSATSPIATPNESWLRSWKTWVLLVPLTSFTARWTRAPCPMWAMPLSTSRRMRMPANALLPFTTIVSSVKSWVAERIAQTQPSDTVFAVFAALVWSLIKNFCWHRSGHRKTSGKVAAVSAAHLQGLEALGLQSFSLTSPMNDDESFA